MNCEKIGNVIKKIRLEKGLTQKQLADKLFLSDKTISKWERGIGCPDISVLLQLSDILGINIDVLLEGELSQNSFVGGNMKKSKIYVCPECGNITFCTGNAEVSCCGRKTECLVEQKADEKHSINVEQIENDWYLTSEHPMEKGHYISFVAFMTGEKVQIFKQYPEWNLSLRFAKREHGKLLWYCTKHGLFYKNI